MRVLPGSVLQRAGRLERLKDVDAPLSLALEENGYVEKSYYAVPRGFALVTRIEQIELDGSSKNPPTRWSVDPSRLTEFSLREYLSALFTANPGYYRVIVFVITDTPFHQSGSYVTRDEATKWLRSGLNVLPELIGTQPYTPTTVCTTLIYEFERQQDQEPTILVPGRLDAQIHLVKSGLWNSLGGSV